MQMFLEVNKTGGPSTAESYIMGKLTRKDKIMDPDIGDLEGNLSTLRALLPAPCLGLIPHAPQASPAELASSLDLQPLFA